MESAAFDGIEAGRALGYDLYSRNRIAPSDAWPQSIVEGFAAAAGQAIARPYADRHVRKWLQLRLNAYRRQRLVNDDVTPGLLRQIDVVHCPVTRVALTHGELLDSDWSIDRINNGGGYAANNLAVMSTRANRAKGARRYEDVFALSQRSSANEWLSPAQWLRMAALMLGPCFARCPGAAPAIPLAAPIPNRSLRPAVQQVQHVFTQAARRQAGKNALIKQFKQACATPAGLLRLHRFSEACTRG